MRACAWPTSPARMGCSAASRRRPRRRGCRGAPARRAAAGPGAAVGRSIASRAIAAPARAAARGRSAATITLDERAAIIRAALGRAAVVLQDLLRGVRDRVVVAVTFLAMLELMKRREIVVEQAEPLGPIVARRTTAEERAAAGRRAPTSSDAPLDESLESFA